MTTNPEPDPEAPVTTVIYDVGQVLVHWDPYLPYANRGLRAEAEEFFVATDFFTFNHRQDAGRSWAEARVEMAERFPQYLHLLDLYVEHFAETLYAPVDGSAELAEELLAAGVRVYGLSNWAAEQFHFPRQVNPVIDRFADVVVSGEVGLAKPDPAVFSYALHRFGVTPGEALFVDDSPANVAAARTVGLHAHLFTTTELLRADLVARTVLPS